MIIYVGANHVMIIHFGKDFWETLSHSFDIYLWLHTVSSLYSFTVIM